MAMSSPPAPRKISVLGLFRARRCLRRRGVLMHSPVVSRRVGRSRPRPHDQPCLAVLPPRGVARDHGYLGGRDRHHPRGGRLAPVAGDRSVAIGTRLTRPPADGADPGEDPSEIEGTEMVSFDELQVAMASRCLTTATRTRSSNSLSYRAISHPPMRSTSSIRPRTANSPAMVICSRARGTDARPSSRVSSASPTRPRSSTSTATSRQRVRGRAFKIAPCTASSSPTNT